MHGAFIVRTVSKSHDVLTALTSAGALVITHAESDEQTVTLNSSQTIAAVNIDELLRILEDQGILQGETKR